MKIVEDHPGKNLSQIIFNSIIKTLKMLMLTLTVITSKTIMEIIFSMTIKTKIKIIKVKIISQMALEKQS